jgi:ketosteroid isomerase-like protein
MENQAQSVMERMFRALERRDKADFMACVAEDAIFFDPHYPTPEMRGREAIDAGISWGLSMMKQFGFRTVHFFPGEGGLSGAFEIDTNHELKSGQKLSFPQVFIVETKDGLLTRMRAYEPYGPNGIGGFFLGLERLKQRFFGK